MMIRKALLAAMLAFPAAVMAEPVLDMAKTPAEAPPMFAALAMDDMLFGNGDFGIVSAWKAAKRPVELHVYERGNHGFGLGQPGTTSTGMIGQFISWLDARGLLKPESAK